MGMNKEMVGWDAYHCNAVTGLMHDIAVRGKYAYLKGTSSPLLLNLIQHGQHILLQHRHLALRERLPCSLVRNAHVVKAGNWNLVLTPSTPNN